ncbi:hypothetical protein L226DRAFT_611741 [Lentinus tigrinus ALCF2SS1-7]|uniref:Uncharacterized protein n=1 Tax=Lentinus tigrinus ALCF2SS1-6 TaxID=1328759 RepID=A0A5C2SKG1_9APHY|nr:hypothetical protein L227DRAFT_607840 [Lentinus tigrinus ALCF2SS1-6]RPD76343.1 hypothetical protein L226DRAFT_611741 [Lentinus tigrinus ALCF2SS1-7]
MSDVSVLEVRIDHRDWMWKDLFASMTKICFLVDCYDQDDDFLEALSATPNRTRGSRQRSLILPSLQVVKLSRMRLCTLDYAMEIEFIDALLDTLIKRCNYGIPLLQQHLVRCMNIDKGDVNRFADIVPEDFWDRITELVESKEESSDDEEKGNDEEEEEFQEEEVLENDDEDEDSEDEDTDDWEEDEEGEQYDQFLPWF